MPGNKAVAYIEPGKVEVQTIDYPELVLKDGPGVNKRNVGRKCEHGVILKIVSTNICGSDQHMVRGRTTAPSGLILGHEITGEVIELGRDVEFIKKGDLVSVPFNIACGRCRNCKEGKTGICLNVNPDRPGSAYGYVDMGGWVGGQAEYVMVPYADWNLLKFPDKDQAMEKILDLTMLSDIFPTGFHGAFTAGVGPGSTVYVAGGGPVGLAAAHSAQFLGAAVVIVGDMIPERLKQAESFGCETVDLTKSATLAEQVEQILGVPEVDAAVLDHGYHASRRSAGHSGPVRNRRPGRHRRRGEDRQPIDPARPRLGQVALVYDGSDPGDALPPRADGGDPPRPRPDRQGSQRDRDPAGRRSEGLQGLRQGGKQEVCSQSPWIGQASKKHVLSSRAFVLSPHALIKEFALRSGMGPGASAPGPSLGRGR